MLRILIVTDRVSTLSTGTLHRRKMVSASAVESNSHSDELQSLANRIEQAAHLLPSQGPITAFVHHNTLHAFEDLEFDAAVRRGAELFGCHPYLPEADYRKAMLAGRIQKSDIDAALHEWLENQAPMPTGWYGSSFELFRAILQHDLHDGPTVDVRWVLGETDGLNRFRADGSPEVREQMVKATQQWVMRDLRITESPDLLLQAGGISESLAERLQTLFGRFKFSSVESWPESRWESLTLNLLWEICQFGVHQAGGTESAPIKFVRQRDGLLRLTGEDCDERVNEILVPFCAAFMDQGFSDWPLPERDLGLASAFAALYGCDRKWNADWLRAAAGEVHAFGCGDVAPLESIQQSLLSLSTTIEDCDQLITQALLALRGFAGMIRQLETRGDRASRSVPTGSLVEFLAIRLILDRFVAISVASEAGFDSDAEQLNSWIQQRLDQTQRPVDQELKKTFRLFELAQLLDWRPAQLARNSNQQWFDLMALLDQFTDIDRRQIFHLAYERNYRQQTLDAVHEHCRRVMSQESNASQRRQDTLPDFQMVNCIDDREESLRRHLEEVHPNCETFGAAGFFAIPMYYRGAADAHYTPLCPVIVKPQHYVREQVVYSLKGQEDKRKRARRTIGTVTHRVHIGSRTFTGGWIGTVLLGSLATFPLVARILFPRLTAQVRQSVGGFVKPPEVTQLVLQRDPKYPPGPEPEQQGFTLDEMADIVERLLLDIGLTKRFARLFFVCGHGSASLNNPHEAAYDCGACAGARGGPNARAFAQMANNSEVRKRLAERGLELPEETLFVGCYHNTCDDKVDYYDLDRIPPSHREEFEAAVDAIDEARRRDAHERCRRFESAPLSLTFDEALRHVESRSEDLSQVRPECGHATNALCFVGDRKWSRGLFLDRRAFLQSYDPQQDGPETPILERILQAVIPVCAGINLEYYFSFVDREGYGCGTKLPHNITSLIGVMNGAGSDLLPGLPWQMVEIHEPIRLLFVIESTPAALQRIMENNEGIRKLCAGNWVQLAVLDSATAAIQIYRNGQFEPFQPTGSELKVAPDSVSWYRGWRANLGFASIGWKGEPSV